MSSDAMRAPGILGPLWTRIKRWWVLEVPEGDALCEFDCRKEQCRDGEWASCSRRLSKAAGELMPPDRAVLPEQKR